MLYYVYLIIKKKGEVNILTWKKKFSKPNKKKQQQQQLLTQTLKHLTVTESICLKNLF